MPCPSSSSKWCFRLQQENVHSFPSSVEERQRQGIASCVGIISLLTHCLLWSILLSDMSVTRGGEGDVTAVLMEQPVLSGQGLRH